MYFIAVRSTNKYYVEQIENDWHDAVDSFEPVDVLKGELIVFDDMGNKYYVGPEKQLKENKIFWKIKSVDTGSWDFKNGEPFLIDSKEQASNELKQLLIEYAERHNIMLPDTNDTELGNIVVAVSLSKLKSKMPATIVEAHTHSSSHSEEIKQSKICGCFYCLEIFTLDKIEEWVDDNRTGLCPNCGIDAVLGDKSGYPITKEFLTSMNEHWFEGDGIKLG
jgi:hypothetical protein